MQHQTHTNDLGIADRISRSKGRAARNHNANARVTKDELAILHAAAKASGQALGEWTREALLAAASTSRTDRVLLTELTALRMLLMNVLRPIALGQRVEPASYQAMLDDVRNHKHDAAQSVLAQYAPTRNQEQ